MDYDLLSVLLYLLQCTIINEPKQSIYDMYHTVGYGNIPSDNLSSNISTTDGHCKDKEALFNVAYNVTDNISSPAILPHNNIFNRYLPALLKKYLPSTTPFMRAPARELLVPFFTPLVWCVRGIRTHDLPFRKRTLYQLSYQGGTNYL